MTTGKNNAAPDPQPAELAEQKGIEVQLPEFGINTSNHAGIRIRGYTAEQMEDYARAALAATSKQQVDPAWSLHDRVEFALRDAGFDLDEASRIALIVDRHQVGEVQGDALVASLVQIMNAEYDGLGRLPADVLGVLNIAAEALAARQPGAQVPVAYWLAVDKDGVVEFGISADDANGGQASRQEVNDFINGPLHEAGAPHRLVGVYAAPPAHGIDLGKLWEQAHAAMLTHRKRNKHDCFVLRCLKDDVQKLIDGKRDAAPGVSQ